MIPQATETSPEDWKYVSEGGATIVFSYIGTPKPQFDGTVLRLRKAVVPTVVSNGVDVHDEPDDPLIMYQRKCMEKLIPAKHLPILQSVSVTRQWLETLVHVHDYLRPEERRAKDHIDLTRTKGVLATDLVGGDGLAVEIKPKWAFLPSSVHLSSATRETKTRTCRFCMHSAIRARAGDNVAVGYCPLDLFSGKKNRVKKAIYELWNAWVESNGAINNLKVFVQGKLIAPSEAASIFANGTQKEEAYQEDIREAFASAILPLLLETPILRVLSKLQRTLDILDIEGLSKLWQLAETSAPLYRTTFASFFEGRSHGMDDSPPPPSPIGVSSLFLSSPEPTISDWSDFIDQYLSPTTLDHLNPTPLNLRYYLLAYLLSATFKDCSIIVRLNRLRPTSHTEEVKPEQVTLIDLDPKSMTRLRKWEILDQTIVRQYIATGSDKVCIDESQGQ